MLINLLISWYVIYKCVRHLNSRINPCSVIITDWIDKFDIYLSYEIVFETGHVETTSRFILSVRVRTGVTR